MNFNLSELSREIILRDSQSPTVSGCDEYRWNFDGFELILVLCWKMERISRVVLCCGRAADPVLGRTIRFEGNRGCARCWWQSGLHQSRKDCITAAEKAETGIQSHQRFSGRGHPDISTSMTTQTGSFLFSFSFFCFSNFSNYLHLLFRWSLILFFFSFCFFLHSFLNFLNFLNLLIIFSSIILHSANYNCSDYCNRMYHIQYMRSTTL